MSTLQQTPVEQFKLPEKLIRILHRNHIDTFGELQEVVNRRQLLRLRQVGKKTAAELTRLATQPELYLAATNQDQAPQAQNKSELLIQLDGVHVEKLGLPKKITNALTRASLDTLGDLLLVPPSQFIQINRIGPKAARKIQIALEQALNSPEDYIE
jgi:DNA-directed RNA polymerase alpha subunit